MRMRPQGCRGVCPPGGAEVSVGRYPTEPRRRERCFACSLTCQEGVEASRITVSAKNVEASGELNVRLRGPAYLSEGLFVNEVCLQDLDETVSLFLVGHEGVWYDHPSGREDAWIPLVCCRRRLLGI